MKFAIEKKLVIQGYSSNEMCKFYKLSVPLKGNSYIAIVSNRSKYFGDNTMVFSADPRGRITYYAPLFELSILLKPEEVLTRLGYHSHSVLDRSILNQKPRWN